MAWRFKASFFPWTSVATVDANVTTIESVDATTALETAAGAALTTAAIPAATVTALGTGSTLTSVKLASDGLDAVATTAPTGPATTFREMVVQTWRRWFRKSTMTETQLKTYADNGTTVVTTQTVADDGTVETQGTAT
jgi:hypothetical protein